MKISELIMELEKIKVVKGDLEVFVDDGYVLSDGASLRIQKEDDDVEILILR